MKLPNEIDEYLASRNFSENTRSNYHYDLVSLQAFFEDKSLTTENLELYKIQISNLSPAAQRRKISSANQYLTSTLKLNKSFKKNHRLLKVIIQ